MPNWCYTRIEIECESKDDAKRLNSLINKWTSFNYYENGFGLDWLGNIVGNSGIDSADYKNNKDFSVRCRGRLLNNELISEHVLLVETENA